MRKKFFLKVLPLTIFCSSLLVSCNPSEKSDSYIRVISEKNLHFEFDGNLSSEIMIESDAGWVISVPENAGWITFDKTVGMNDAVVSVSVAENMTGIERMAVVTIGLLDNSKAEELTITQSYNEDMDVFLCIKDPFFREYCKEFDLNKDGILSLSEASQVEFIDVTPGAYTSPQELISSFAGIEFFPNLISLSFSNNIVEEIDLSGNCKLKELIAIQNRLGSIDVSGCPDLEYLYLSRNSELKELDVTNNPKLIVLFTEDNSLIPSIDLSNCTELTDLSMFRNSLEEIDLSSNRKLKNVYLGLNKISKIDVTMLQNLERLSITANKISGELDVTHNTKLKVLEIGNNEITSVEVSNCPDLNTLMCTSNKLTEIDLSKNSKLTSLHCSDNLFSRLDISGCPGMVQFLCTNQKNLEEIDISNCSVDGLVSFWAFENPKLKTIWVWEGFEGVPPYSDWSLQDGAELKIR